MLEERTFPKKDWFEQTFGFDEFNGSIDENFEVIEYLDHVDLKSKINNKTYNAGKFQIKSTSRDEYKLSKKDRRGTLNIIKGYGSQSKYFELVDILSMQSLPKWNGATYLVASNFNCLEFTDPSQKAADGVTNYYEDNTQGPYAALACSPAAVYRNYFVKHENNIGQISKEINLLEKTPIKVKHGYAIINNDKYLKQNNSEFDMDDPTIWKVGIHTNCEVVMKRGEESTFSMAPKNQISNHVYAAALNFKRNVKPTYLTKEIALKLLTAEYRAAILSAWENSLKFKDLEGSNKLSLTLLGGGVFGNPYEIICDAINENIELIIESGLDVYITCFNDDIYNQIEDLIIDGVNETDGKVIDTNDDLDCEDLI